MLGKLLKYDLKWCYKPTLLIFYIMSILSAIITRLVNLIDNSFIFYIIGKICIGVTIAMIVNVLINNFMRVWARVRINLYKDEAYLTHTLPISRGKIFLAKTWAAIITMITSFLVILLTLFIAFFTKDTWQILKEYMESTALYFNSSVSSVVIVLAVTVFCEFLFLMMAGILGIVIGNRSNNLKLLKSVIFGVLLYMIASSLSIAGVYVAGLINPEVMELFNSTTNISTKSLKIVSYFAIGIYLVYDVIYYFIGKKVLNKGVNVD